jgi:hypothetical protein
VKEFLASNNFSDLPDEAWFDIDSVFDDWDTDLFSELNLDVRVSFDKDNNLTIHEITPVLSSLKESYMIHKDLKTFLSRSDSEKIDRVAAKVDIINSFKTLNSGIYALPKNQYKLPSGQNIGKVMQTKVNRNGIAVTAKNLSIAEQAHKNDWNLIKVGTITSEVGLTKDAFNLATLKFIHSNYAPNISFERWLELIDSLDTTHPDHSRLHQELIHNRHLDSSTIEALYKELKVKKSAGVKMASPAGNAFAKIKDIGLKGAQRGVVGSINRRFVREVTAKFGNSLPQFFHTVPGQKALEGLLPALALIAIQFDVSNKIPYKAAVEKVATVALDDWAGDGAALLTDGILDFVGPFLDEYRQAAASLELTETSEEEEEFEEPSVPSTSRQRERALAAAGSGMERTKTI